MARKRLYFDIETSPNLGLFWEAGYKKQIDYNNIIKERAIICICWKWEGEKEVYSLNWDKKQSDKKMLQDFIPVANIADEIIGHNGDKFDLAWIRTRCLFHRIPMFPKYTTVDTLKVSRSQFKFNSNRLNYIAQFLGLGEKIKTEYNLWKDIMLNNCPDAMAKMVKYCKKDVVLLEKVYDEMKQHILPKTHYGVLFGTDRATCPECGSDHLIKIKTRTTATGLRKAQVQCKTCHKFSTHTDK